MSNELAHMIPKVIARQPAEAGQASHAASQPAATNRAAWPSGPLPACAIASQRAIPSVAYGPIADAMAEPAPGAA